MGNTSYAKIGNYTKSIVVDGETGITIELDWVDVGSGNYASEMYIELGERSEYSALTIGDSLVVSKSFVIPLDWLNEIPDSSEGIGRIRVQSVNMNTGNVNFTQTKEFKVYVPEEYKPEVSDINVSMVDVRNIPVDYAVYGITRPYVSAKVKAHSTSPIKKYRITGGGLNQSGDCFFDSGDSDFGRYGTPLKAYANTSLTLTVEDGRGRTAKITSDEFYVQQYTRPSISGLSAYRVDDDGIIKADGGKIKVTVNAGFSPIKNSNDENVNSLKCYLQYKKVNEDSYYGFTEIINNEPYMFEADPNYNYDIRCEVRDEYTSSEAYFSILGNHFDINVADGGGGAAIGTKAEKGYFDVAYESRFQKGVEANGVVSSKDGIVSTGTKSKGDFLSFGTAERIATLWHHIGSDPSNPIEVDSWGDFNDATEIGMYGVYYDADVSSSSYYKVLNAPCEKAGTLRVYDATGNMLDNATELYRMQEYVVRDGSGVYRRCLYKIRPNIDSTWPLEWTIPETWHYYPSEEAGTSDDWHYKKYSDGTVDLWCRKRYSSLTLDGTSNGEAYSTEITMSLPFDIKNAVMTGIAGGLCTVCNPTLAITGDDEIKFRLKRQGALPTSEVDVNLIIKADWI